jgi:hypothetical protein
MIKMFILQVTTENQKRLVVGGTVSENFRKVALCLDNNVVYLWDLTNENDPKIDFAVRTSDTSSSAFGEVYMALSPSGKFLLVQENNCPIFIWSTSFEKNTKVGRLIATLSVPFTKGQGQVTSALFSGDLQETNVLVSFFHPSGTEPKNVDCALYTIPNSDSTSVISSNLNFRGHEGRICSLGRFENTNLWFTGSYDSKALAWIEDSCKCSMFLSHPTRTIVQLLIPIPGGTFIATAASDGFIRIWGCHPVYERSFRGFAQLIARLNPPALVCKKGAYIVGLVYDMNRQGLTAIWRCNESAVSVPEPSVDTLEETYSFVQHDVKQASAIVKIKKIKTSEADEKPGVSSSSSTPKQFTPSSRLLVAINYDRIPCLVSRHRSNVALQLSQLLQGRAPTKVVEKKILKAILNYV